MYTETHLELGALKFKGFVFLNYSVFNLLWIFKQANSNKSCFFNRFLGNPASGVKPMYSVHANSEQEKPQEKVVENREIKKHSIVKIDPKTLKPISEKAPETTSLSSQVSATADLKINTSSVSIFNPLKLQSEYCSHFILISWKVDLGKRFSENLLTDKYPPSSFLCLECRTFIVSTFSGFLFYRTLMP